MADDIILPEISYMMAFDSVESVIDRDFMPVENVKPEVMKTRKNFPESWIFDQIETTEYEL